MTDEPSKMAIPHPKQQPPSKPKVQPEEIKAEATRHFENALFAILGAISALVTGLALYGDFQTPFHHPENRGPASSESILIETQPTEYYQQMPNGR
jgi:hypothetical protein